MGRPRADAPGPKAQERIVDAFWTLLSEADYSSMSMAGLVKRADVNHNTFYRYHKSLDSLAVALAADSAAHGMAFYVVPAFCGPEASYGERGKIGGQDAEKALLVAESGSRPLVDAMCSAAIRLWAGGEGGGASELDEGDIDRLTAVFWGVAAMAGGIPRSSLVERAESFRTSAMGEAAKETLVEIAGKCSVA